MVRGLRACNGIRGIEATIWDFEMSGLRISGNGLEAWVSMAQGLLYCLLQGFSRGFGLDLVSGLARPSCNGMAKCSQSNPELAQAWMKSSTTSTRGPLTWQLWHCINVQEQPILDLQDILDITGSTLQGSSTRRLKYCWVREPSWVSCTP